jgi:hypothetical protein
MFVFADVYFHNVENARIVFYHGRVGSYKTLSAVATAYHLLKSGNYKRCYANIPVTFASSPPDYIEKGEFDFLNQDYATNSIFIIDESAQFLSGEHSEIKKLYAYPRKMNQVFLLASALPTKQIESYCHCFCFRSIDFSLIGLPLLQFRVSPSFRATKQDMSSHYILGYARYFGKYNTRYRPESAQPIKQYRDSGILYDERSREVIPQISKYFIVNQFGEAIRKPHLSLEEADLVNSILPIFDVSAMIDEKHDYPRVQKKVKFGLNFLGAEFRFSFLLYAIGLVYVALIMINTLFTATSDMTPPKNWGFCEIGKMLTIKNINDCKGATQNETKIQSKKMVKPTPTEIRFTIEK